MIRTVSAGLILLCASAAVAQPDPDTLTGGLLVADTATRTLYLCRDLNGNGDAEDPGETTLYLDAGNASNFPLAASQVLSIGMLECEVLIGETDTDTIYVLIDLNADGDVNGTGEVRVGFAGGINPAGFPLQTPSGVVEANGFVWAVTAGTSTTPAADAIYRLTDNNDNGDAMDPGEAVLWCDLGLLVPGSSPFNISFLGDAAFVPDLRGGASDVILRARDADGSGSVDAGELTVFYDSASGLGPTGGFAVATRGNSVLIADGSPAVSPQRVYALTDVGGNGTIDSAGEVRELWNETLVPAGFTLGTIFDIAPGPGGSLAVASSGADTADNVLLLRDLDGNGDYLGAGETTVYVSGHGAGVFPDTIRALRFVRPPGLPECQDSPPCDPDANQDGNVDQDDVAYLINVVGGGENPTGIDPDFNRDGNVDQDDVAAIINVIAGGECP
jgi:hypothetical protein